MYTRKQLLRLCLLNLLGIVLCTGAEVYAQCPTLKAVLVDPCGDEVQNEFLILDSGTGFNTRDLQISFDITGNGEAMQNNDINVNVDNFPSDARPCRFQPGNPNLIEGCPNVRVVSQDEEIPPNAIVIIQLSGGANEVVDFSYLCGNGECIYVLQNDCIRTIEAFSNQGSGTRSTLIALRNAAPCETEYVYDRNLLDGGDGAFFAPQGPSLYDNRGCNVTPPVSGATIPPEFVNPGNLIGCGSFTLPAISGTNLTGGERYYTGPYGTGIIYSPGSRITKSITLFIFDPTAPCSPLEFFQVTIVEPVTPELVVPDPVCEGDGPIALNTIQDGINGSWSGNTVSGNTFFPDLSGSGIYTLIFTPDPDECANPNSIDLQVRPSPKVTNGLSIVICSEEDSEESRFDLTTLTQQLNEGSSDPISWFEDAALSRPIVDPVNYVTNSTQVYAVVDNGICPSPPVSVDLRIGTPPEVRFIDVKNISCAGGADGAIEMEVEGGTPPYQINWSNSTYNGLQSVSSLSAGTYNVTITDSLGCSSTNSTTLIDPAVLELICNKLEDVKTVISQDGKAGFSVSGGTPPYAISWKGSLADSTILLSAGDTLYLDTLRAGMYDVQVRDALGCLAFCQFEIEAPICDLEVSSTWIDPSCFAANNGSITITADGAKGDLRYEWNRDSLNGRSAATNLPAGQYEIRVIDDIGCSELLSIELQAPPLLELDCAVQAPVSVRGGKDGRARIQVAGGTPPYQADWMGPKTGNLSIGMATEFIIDSLPTGTYELQLTDANACEQFCSFTIPEGACLSTLNLDITNESCPDTGDGAIQLNLEGPWATPIIIDWNIDQFDGQTELNDLTPGLYSVTVTGSNSCQAFISASVDTDYTLPELNLPARGEVCQNDCFTYPLEFSGTPPFFAEIILRDGNQMLSLNMNTSQFNENLVICPADYGLTEGRLLLEVLRVSDANCINEESIESVLNIIPPVAAVFSPTLCPEESVEVNGRTYDIMRPSGTEVLLGAGRLGCDSIVNVNLKFETAPATEIVQILCPGEELIVNDQVYNINRPTGTESIPTDNGCDSLVTVDLSFYPPAVGRLEATLCPGEELIIQGQVYNAQNPVGTAIFPGGSATGCDSLLQISLTYYEEARSLLAQTLCPGEEVMVNGQIYNETNPVGTEIISGGSQNGCDSIVQIELSYFESLVYELRDTLCSTDSRTVNGRIYDIDRPSGMEVLLGGAANGCDSLVQIALTFQEDITVSLIGDQDICPGETAVLAFRVVNAITPIDVQYTANGNTPTWIYGLQDGDQVSVNPITTTSYSILAAVAPPEFCPVAIGGGAEVRVSDLMVDAVTNSDYLGYGVSCIGQQDGAIGAQVLSGQGPFQFEWQDGSTAPERTNLSAGVYSVMVTDALGCKAEALAQLEPPPAVELELSTLPPDCWSDQSGVILIDTVFGGNPPYTYRVDGDTSQLIDQFPQLIGGLAPGRHTLEVSDEFGCSTGREVVVPEFIPLELSLGPDEMIHYGESVRLDGTANFPIDSLTWTPSGSLSPSSELPTMATPAKTTMYTLTAYDNRGCSVTDRITVFVNRENSIYVPTAFSPNGDGRNDRIYPFTNQNIREIVVFRIFDRWGNLMHEKFKFQGNEEKFGWDGIFKGQKMDPAVFIFYVKFTYQDGKEGIIKGDFALVN